MWSIAFVEGESLQKKIKYEWAGRGGEQLYVAFWDCDSVYFWIHLGLFIYLDCV